MLSANHRSEPALEAEAAIPGQEKRRAEDDFHRSGPGLGTLCIVMLAEGFRGRASLFQGGRALDVETFLLIGSMVTLNERIVLGMVWWADMHLDTQAQPKASQSRWKITALWRAYRTGITVQRDPAWQPVEFDGLGQ
jgi:hypothetical protein